MKKLFLVLSLLTMAIAFQPGFCQKTKYYWRNEPNSLALMKVDTDQGNLVLWRLNIDPSIKPFFHPVCSPDGTLLSAEAPSDHLWHLGQWFCWKYINKVNYWEYTGDPKMAISEGRTHVKSIKISTSRNGKATIRMTIEYHPWEQIGNIVMNEIRTITVAAPDRNGSYAIEYDMKFKAVSDILLDRTPVQTNADGVTWGGYAGLSMRFDQKLFNPHYLSSSTDSVTNGIGYSFVAANLKTRTGKTVQMIIFDHPDNPRYPTPWYTINRPKDKFWFFSPALLYHSALHLDAGEKMRLQYKILIPASPLTVNDILKEAPGRR
jgi:hypothetical protein